MRGPCAAYNLSRKLHAFLCRFYRCSCCWSLSRRRGNCCIWFVILLVSRHPLVALLLIVMIWRRCMRLQAGYYRSVVFLNDNLWCSTITEATLANILREFLVYWIICFCFFFSTCLQNLDQWSLRKSWLELQLMIKQVSKEVSHNSSFLSRIVWARKSNSINLIFVVGNRTSTRCSRYKRHECLRPAAWHHSASNSP